eukprot:194880-Rhodomonas_salina.1
MQRHLPPGDPASRPFRPARQITWVAHAMRPPMPSPQPELVGCRATLCCRHAAPRAPGTPAIPPRTLNDAVRGVPIKQTEGRTGQGTTTPSAV